MQHLSPISLWVNLAATWYMVGLIWFVQLVHYPLMSRVPADQFAEFEQAHQRRTTWVVMPPMLLELATAVILVWLPPAGMSRVALAVGLGLASIIWISTFLWQAPTHFRLEQGFDRSLHQWLVNSNWIRTIAWSMRGILMSVVMFRMWGITAGDS